MKILYIILTIIITIPAFSESQVKMVLQTGNQGTINNIVFSNDNKIFAVLYNNNTIKIWSIAASLIRELHIESNYLMGDMCISSDNQHLYLVSSTVIYIINIDSGISKTININYNKGAYNKLPSSISIFDDNLIVGVKTINTYVILVSFTIDDFENKILTNNMDIETRFNLLNTYMINDSYDSYVIRKNILITDTSKLTTYFYEKGYSLNPVIEYSNDIELWSLDGNFIKTITVINKSLNGSITKIIVNNDKSKILCHSQDGNISLLDMNSGILNYFPSSISIYNFKFTDDDKLFGWISSDGLKILNNSGKFLININKTFGNSDFDIKSKTIVESITLEENKMSNPLLRYSGFDNKIIKDIPCIETPAVKVLFTNDMKYVVLGTSDGTIYICNKETDEYVSCVSFENEWISYTHDGYWDASNNGGNLVSMVADLDVFGIDQFAFRNNRPDILLTRLGIADDSLIDHYYYQYLKRLKRLNISPDQVSQELNVPEVKITKITTNDKYCDMSFLISDAIYNLNNYNIFVNDVPIYGSYGKPISGKSVSLNAKIELNYGDNKIEISASNEKGADSIRALANAKYNKPVKGDLYYIGFGVSKYKDNKLNLQYAHKDAIDLSDTFSKMTNKYNKIYSYTYINEQVTIENIKKAKNLLKNAKVDDTLVLFIAGHGVHDQDNEATYYYLTHNTDLKNLSGTAANFEYIEDILQGIPHRYKLFLMDTCESGEIEEGIQDSYYAMSKSRGIKPRSINGQRGLSVKVGPKNVKTYLYEKDRYIYNDLLRRSGAIVFSSCKGGEFSYEDEKIGNGFFTSKIMECFLNKNSDKNKDGIISIDELKSYVIKGVQELSDGFQNPTVDRDNIYLKFGF